MKQRILTIFAVLIITVSFLGCNGGGSGSSNKKEEINFDKTASYALGLNVGSGLRDGLEADGIHPNMSEFMKGMRDGLSGGKTRIDVNDAHRIIMEAIQEIEKQQEALMMEQNEGARLEEIAFLAENARKPGITMTSSGLQYEVLETGNGPKPSENSFVKVHYEGRLTDGTLFDNSYERQEPAVFPLDRVIAGWTEGIQLMNTGSRFRFYIPSELGYGVAGGGPIPPFSTLIFTVELLEVLPSDYLGY
ncbi:MAG: FKBP-type peptidyl-prolyl cis-trans isomerase [Treponema sp.]|nr:FKBP-type peptidyl-prolyl cis-trans isomerase [Treponema sp.]MCL2237565.1 FKBP-type peptidyl-prolyl cis-trans isomerase [Treponema sp.]